MNRFKKWLIKKLGGTPNDEICEVIGSDKEVIAAMVEYPYRPDRAEESAWYDECAKERLMNVLKKRIEPEFSSIVNYDRMVKQYRARITIPKKFVKKEESK